MEEEVFRSRQAHEVIRYVREKYGDELEFLWPRFSRNAIWRNQKNQKWYALLLVVSREKLGLESGKEVEIIDVRFDRGEALDFAASNAGVFPGYHMNKNNWITVVLDGSVETGVILGLVDHSYEISLGK